MALANTLTLADLYDLLKVAPDGYRFTLDFNQQRALTGGGDRLVSDRGPALLSAALTTIPVPHAEAEGIMALINSRAGGLKSMLLANPRLPYPASDPDGTIVDAATPSLGTITDRLHVAFAGFPAGYVLPLGTWFQVIFDTSRYYLGQFVEARIANGSGAVASVEIFPPLPASVSFGAAVSVKKSAAKFKAVGGSAYISTDLALHSRVTFAAEQTYAAG